MGTIGEKVLEKTNERDHRSSQPTEQKVEVAHHVRWSHVHYTKNKEEAETNTSWTQIGRLIRWCQQDGFGFFKKLMFQERRL